MVATDLIGSGNTGVARCSETFPVVAGELAPCRRDPHSAVQAVGLAVLVRGSGPTTQDVGAGGVEVHFSCVTPRSNNRRRRGVEGRRVSRDTTRILF